MDMINITNKMSGNTQVILFEGSIVYQNMNVAKGKIQEIFANVQGYILDFTNIKKIDSTGFGLVFSIYKRKTEASKMVVVVQDPFIEELFKITKIDQVMPVVSSMSDALKVIEG